MDTTKIERDRDIADIVVGDICASLTGVQVVDENGLAATVKPPSLHRAVMVVHVALKASHQEACKGLSLKSLC